MDVMYVIALVLIYNNNVEALALAWKLSGVGDFEL